MLWIVRAVPSMLLAAAATAYFYYRNHKRVCRAKSCMRAVRLFPPASAPVRPFPLVFLAGTAQKADVWRVRMELLRAAGYECHALEFVQTGRYLTTYSEQVERLRAYITEQLDDARPVLIGHSQGGTKVQQYLLAEGGDAGVPPEHSVRAAVLMSSSGPSLLRAVPAVLCRVAAASGAVRTVCACVLGTLYLDPTAFLFGGGPWRRALGLRGLFNAETRRTSLASAEGPSDARTPLASSGGEGGAGSLGIADWRATYVCDHDPFVADLGALRHARTPAQALSANGCALLHLVAAEDALIPKAMSAQIGASWGVRPDPTLPLNLPLTLTPNPNPHPNPHPNPNPTPTLTQP